MIGSYFNKHIFGDSPYGNPVDGTKTGISSISDAKIKEFYQTNYRPESSAIAVVGDFNSVRNEKIDSEIFWRMEK